MKDEIKLFGNNNNNKLFFIDEKQSIIDLFIQGTSLIFRCNENIERLKISAPNKFRIIRKLVEKGGILFRLSSYLKEKASTNNGKDFTFKELHMSYIFKFLCLNISQECINAGIPSSHFQDMGSAFNFIIRYINAFLIALNNPENKDELIKTNKEAFEKCVELGVNNEVIKSFVIDNIKNVLLDSELSFILDTLFLSNF